MSRLGASDSARLLLRIGRLWVAFVRGHLLKALIIGALTWLVGSAIGLPGALWLGVVAGVLEPVPNLGPLVATVPAVVIALWQGSNQLPVKNWVFALIVAGAYVLIQELCRLLIEPHVLGKQLDLPPLAVFLAVLVGGLLANVAGALLAVPLLVSVREIIRYAWRKAKGLPAFAEEESAP